MIPAGVLMKKKNQLLRSNTARIRWCKTKKEMDEKEMDEKETIMTTVCTNRRKMCTMKKDLQNGTLSYLYDVLNFVV